MARELDVYLHRRLIGKLNQDDHGAKTFDYAKEWLNDPDAYPVSHSLPLRQHQFTGKECQAYFAGILPEANSRQMVAKNLGISAKNYFAMLWEIGGDCAGAVTFIPAGQSLSDPNARLHNLTDQEFAAILAELPKRPLLAGDDGVRLSLAGAQNKFALHIANGHISIPLGGVPSTHIVKPAIEHFDGSVFNEAFCMRLAREIGLPTARVDVDNVEGIDYLMVERYDRVTKEDHRLERLHQEDFCQALGVVPENKYQNEGGSSLKQCFDLVREVSSSPVLDLRSLLDGAIFNFLIGNNDAHGKNFSLIYQHRADSTLQTRLAPFYDLLSTAYYPELSPRMAMKIGGEYLSEKVALKDFERLSAEVGLSKPMVLQRVRSLAATVEKIVPNIAVEHPVADAVAKATQARCRNAMDRFDK